MRNHNSLAFVAAILLVLPFAAAAAAQPKGGKSVHTPDSAAPTGPKGGKAVSSLSVPKVVSATIVKEVRPNEGNLVLLVVPEAKVTLQPLRDNKPGKLFTYNLKNNESTLNLAALAPGNYKVTVTHPDYEPFGETVTVRRGEVATVVPKSASKFGEIIVGGAGREAIVLLDQKAWARLSAEAGKIVLARVPVGEHELKITQRGYDDWISKVKVTPGEPTPVVAELKLSVVRLTVKTKPGAKVYLNHEERGTIQADGGVNIANLLPGSYNLRVILDGFEELERNLDLTLDNRAPVEAVELTPIAESGEATENFVTGTAKWSPVPAGWGVDKRGMKIAGEGLGLFKDAGEKRAFNVYRDFTLVLDLRFDNGKGAAWVLRAQDANNYYLFELTTSQHQVKARRLNFYVCQSGQCLLKDSRVVAEEIEKPNDSYQLTIEARGNEFTHKLRVASTPKPDDPQPIGIFKDDTFSYGGIGFRGFNDVEMLVQNFVVVPTAKSNSK